jgi:tRNA (guanine-N7-)-methyltransferase
MTADSPAETYLLRSFGRIKSRVFRPAQQRLLDEALPRHAVALPEDGGLVRPCALFPHAPARVSLEIGFGAGEHLFGMALANPDAGFIGAEPYMNGAVALLRRMEEHGIPNIRIWNDDARLLLRRLEPSSLDAAYILFPDPWPKKKHHKKRLIRTDFLNDLAAYLVPKGRLLVATDHPDYASHIADALAVCPAFTQTNRASPLEPPLGWIPGKYQRKAEEAGREIRFFDCEKIDG